MQYMVEEGDAIQDRQVIFALWERNFGDRQKGRFNWMYENNPHGVPDVWLLRDLTGQVVGVAGVGRRRFHFHGHTYVAGQPMDFVIDKKHRSLGPALLIQRTIIDNMDRKNYSFLYAFPNDKSKMVQKRAGYTQLGHLSRHRIVLKSEQSIKRRIYNNTRIIKLASCLLDTWYRVKNEFFDSRVPNNIVCHNSELLEGDLEGLWQSVTDKNVMIGERSREYLDWRFFQHPNVHYMFFFIVQGANLLGYAIYSFKEGLVNIVDFFTRDKKMLYYLFSKFIKRMIQENAISITLNSFGAKDTLSILSTFGFAERTSGECILLALQEVLPVTELLQPEGWYLTIADRDV